jgi:hypothetical protein
MRRTPLRGEIRKDGLGEEKRSASVKEVRRTAIQADDGVAMFLLLVEAMVATATASLSTIASGALSSLGVGTMMIIPGLSLPC